MTQEKDDPTVTRRGFFGRVLMALGLVSGYGTGAFYFLKFLIPERRPPRNRKLLVAALEELPLDASKTFRDLSQREIVLVRTQEGLKALSTVCTHLGCKVYWEPDKNRFFCPCHEGVFDVNGNVVSGPPPRPLESFPVEVDENDNVFVVLKEA